MAPLAASSSIVEPAHIVEQAKLFKFGGLNRTFETSELKNLVHGLAVGSSGALGKILVGHPFDTIKVRVQTLGFSSPLAAVRRTIAGEGIRGFYRGIFPTVPGVWAYNSALMAGFNVAMGAIKTHRNEHGQLVSLTDIAVASTLGSLLAGTVTQPFDLLRVRAQIQHSSRFVQSTTLQTLRTIVRVGGLRGLYRGFSLTMMREAPANLFYFPVHELIMRQFDYGINSQRALEAPVKLSFLAGGVAGICNWIVILPLDVVRSRVFADSIDPSFRRYQNGRAVAHHILRQEGWTRFFLAWHLA
eukprot:GABV01000860.1.p1 GENE.GABV01000860.1~~GABV01000860.1.p1  ORF type:complete len:301 (-),score=73.81 GABV01000860.1:108-1010(-)